MTKHYAKLEKKTTHTEFSSNPGSKFQYIPFCNYLRCLKGTQCELIEAVIDHQIVLAMGIEHKIKKYSKRKIQNG